MKTLPPILVAEDDPNNLMILRLAFQRARLRNPIVVVRDGQEVVDYLAHSANDGSESFPALALLDLKMPRLDGFDVLTWVASRPDIKDRLPVIVLSSSPHDGDIGKARDLGARDYYVKPHTLGELVIFLNKLSANWLSKPLAAAGRNG